MQAATAEACGQDIDVPDIMLQGTLLLSSFTLVTGDTRDHAARMSTPGAVKSGCNIIKTNTKFELAINTVELERCGAERGYCKILMGF